MTFRAKIFLAIFAFCSLPIAYVFGQGKFASAPILLGVTLVCLFTLLGALASACKVDQMVKDSEGRAFRSEVELQTFLERIHDGVFRVDEQGKVLEINTAMAQFLRYDADFLKGRKLWDFLKCEKGTPGVSFLRAGQIRCTLPMAGAQKTGGRIELIVDLYVLKEKDVFRGFRGCARQASKLLAEEKLKEKVANDLLRSVGSKLRSFHRELDASLASSADPAALRDALERSTKRLRTRFVALSSEEGILNWEPNLTQIQMDPRELVDTVCDKHTAAMREKSLSLVKNCFGERFALHGDPHFLRELLHILVENAIKYSPAGGEVVVTYREDEQSHTFAVSDAGIGMTHDELSRTFSPFFRADNKINAKIAGMGLGLWKARKIADAHKGAISITSTLGKETTLTVTLPRSAQREKDIKWID
ncbi:MAG: ATP-binding protein [Elusimicrobiota bacterium]